MNSQEFKKNICRICLDETIILDWNDPLYPYDDVTYKDCYYKYTQLESLDTERFSTMLCQICVNGLQNVHTLILRALESHKYFQELNLINTGVDNSTNVEDDIKYTPTEFETVLVQKVEVEPTIEDHFVYDENSDEEFNTKPVKNNGGRKSKRCTAAGSKAVKQENFNKNSEKLIKIEKKAEECVSVVDNSESLKSRRRNTRKTKIKVIIQDEKISKALRIDDDTTTAEKEEKITEGPLDDCDVQVEPKVKKKYKEIKKPRMCSICSKILHNKYAVQMHEKTHMENRERKETCKICGLKFYDKRNLYSHKRIHKENREKKHKCDFCNKSFYDKGGLNIHRRIHLGQMIPCSLCSKQYYRQIDLDRHMSSHSATTINSDTKKRSRYFVRCKHCDKSILSTSFKSHTAAHLNEPLMKCSICSKEFFRRGSCVLHVKKVHQKTNEEYNDFIVQYKKNRISHLFLEQKADIQFTDE